MVTSAMAAQNEITLNGAPYGLAEPCSVSRLLELLNMNGKPVVADICFCVAVFFFFLDYGFWYRLNRLHLSPAARLPFSFISLPQSVTAMPSIHVTSPLSAQAAGEAAGTPRLRR